MTAVGEAIFDSSIVLAERHRIKHCCFLVAFLSGSAGASAGWSPRIFFGWGLTGGTRVLRMNRLLAASWDVNGNNRSNVVLQDTEDKEAKKGGHF